MRLSEGDVRAIADYARIGLSEDELPQMTIDLNDTIESLNAIKQFDVDGVEPTFHPIGDLANVLREDIVRQSLDRDFALSDAADSQDGQFKVPSILGGAQ